MGNILCALALLLSAALAQSSTLPSTWPQIAPAEFSDLAYPAEALAKGQAGVVVLRISTDVDGRVIEAQTLSGPSILADVAAANVKSWKLSSNVTGVIAYWFEIDNGACRDDTRSLFRLVRPNFVAVTACKSPGRPVTTWPSEGFDFISFGAMPRHPDFVHNANLTGVVILELTADADGRVTPRPLTDLFLFTDAAVAHARQWRVQPTETKRAIVVYEFAQDNIDCKSEYNTAFGTVMPGYVRLSGCPPWIK